MSEMRTTTHKDPKIIAAAIFVALIVLAGIVLVGAKALGGGPSAAGHNPGDFTPEPAGSSSLCGLPNGDQFIPTTAPSASCGLDP